MWTKQRPRTKRRTSVFAARRANGNHARRIFGTAASVRTRNGFSAAAGWNGTRSIRLGCVRAADINGSGPRACGVRFGRCMRTGTQAMSDKEMIVTTKRSLFTALACLVAMLAISFANHAYAVAPVQLDPNSFLTRGIFFDGELWVLSDGGKLFRIKEGSDAPLEQKLPEPAGDMCLLDGRPAVVTCGEKNCQSWTLRRWNGDKWSDEMTLRKEREYLVALSCDTPKPLLLTSRRLVELDSPKPRSLALSQDLKVGLVASVYATTDRVFVGVNAGEWGGGLRYIDRRTGKVTVLQSNMTGKVCGGPLNTDCDPVNGIVGKPGQPDCVVVAVGLVHFSPHGRLVEVCGERIRPMYFKPFGTERQAVGSRGLDEPFETVAFFGLVRKGETIWAAGIDGIYKAENGLVELSAPLPSFRKVGPFHVNFSVPGVVLVLTSVNRRASISGSVPMLVPR